MRKVIFNTMCVLFGFCVLISFCVGINVHRLRFLDLQDLHVMWVTSLFIHFRRARDELLISD